jgi:hypothetical protein
MIRIHGDRLSLLAALTSHWAEQQLSLPARPASSPSPLWRSSRGTGRKGRTSTSQR